MSCGIGSPKQLFRVVTNAEGTLAPYRAPDPRGGRAPFRNTFIPASHQTGGGTPNGGQNTLESGSRHNLRPPAKAPHHPFTLSEVEVHAPPLRLGLPASSRRHRSAPDQNAKWPPDPLPLESDRA